MFIKLVVIKWRLSDFFSDTDDWMDGPINSGPNCKETNCFFTEGTQTLASLTMPASCGVQKKSYAGPHLGEKTWPFSRLDFCQFFLKKISYNSIERNEKIAWCTCKLFYCYCLVPRRLSFDENVRAKEGGKETTGVCTLPMVPCGSSPVTLFALASAMRKTKSLRRRLLLLVLLV